MIENRPISQRIFDEVGHNMSQDVKDAIEGLDRGESICKDKVKRIFDEIGNAMSTDLREAIEGMAAACSKAEAKFEKAEKAVEPDIPEETATEEPVEETEDVEEPASDIPEEPEPEATVDAE